jgi:hypothetical protein
MGMAAPASVGGFPTMVSMMRDAIGRAKGALVAAEFILNKYYSQMELSHRELSVGANRGCFRPGYPPR